MRAREVPIGTPGSTTLYDESGNALRAYVVRRNPPRPLTGRQRTRKLWRKRGRR